MVVVLNHISATHNRFTTILKPSDCRIALVKEQQYVQTVIIQSHTPLPIQRRNISIRAACKRVGFIIRYSS